MKMSRACGTPDDTIAEFRPNGLKSIAIK